MPLDTNIPLSVQQPKVLSPLDIANARAAMYRNEMAKLDLESAQRSTSARNAMASGFQQGGDPEQASRNAMAIDPNTAITMQRNMALNQQAQYQAQAARREMLMGAFAPVLQQVLSDYEDEIGKGVPIEKAEQNAQKRYSDQVDQVEKGGSLPPELVQWARQRKFNPLVFRYALSQYLPGAQGAPRTRKRIDGGQEIQEQYDPITKRWSEVGRGPRFAKQLDGGAGGTAERALPKGVTEYVDPDTAENYARGAGLAYRLVNGKWQKTTADKLPRTLVKAGSAAAGQGAREAVFTGRMLIGGNEATRDLENVTKLPVTASTGVLGSYQPGPSLLGATSGVLARKVTGQDAQLYQVMSTGFQRSLAQIESAGLAPSGTLTHQMDSVIVKEGDTVITKLSKLAQTRQIVEAGMEPLLDNPRIPKQQKDGIRRMISRIEKAVPFTQQDLIELQYGKSGTRTLKDIIDTRLKKTKPKSGKTSGQDFSHLWGGAKKAASQDGGTSASSAPLNAQGEDPDEDSDEDQE